MRPACPTSEKLQKKQKSRTVQFFAVLCGFSYAPERLFLVILAVFLLIGGLAGEVHPQTLDGVRIHAGQDDCGVHIAALELGELLQSDSSRLILGGRAGQRDQDPVSYTHLQEAYTLACSLETEGQGCWLTVSRTKAPDDPADTARTWVPAPEEECGRLLQFLYENSVQPELWQDAISCWYPQAEQAENLREGGASCEL